MIFQQMYQLKVQLPVDKDTHRLSILLISLSINWGVWTRKFKLFLSVIWLTPFGSMRVKTDTGTSAELLNTIKINYRAKKKYKPHSRRSG